MDFLASSSSAEAPSVSCSANTQRPEILSNGLLLGHKGRQTWMPAHSSWRGLLRDMPVYKPFWPDHSKRDELELPWPCPVAQHDPNPHALAVAASSVTRSSSTSSPGLSTKMFFSSGPVGASCARLMAVACCTNLHNSGSDVRRSARPHSLQVSMQTGPQCSARAPSRLLLPSANRPWRALRVCVPVRLQASLLTCACCAGRRPRG